MTDAEVLDWLLERDQPAVRYLALTQLQGRSASDPEVRETKELLVKRGWASDLLADQRADGSWVAAESLYQPKYLATNWKLLVLADLGVSRTEPRIAKSCALWMRRFGRDDGGFGSDGMGASHLCIVGNTARALLQFGYTDHPRVRAALDWLVEHQAKLGGWSCWGSGRNLDSWEGMSAFAAFPRSKWSRPMEAAVAKGAEYYLSKELHLQGDHYEPWYRFHYPVHYYYDLLVGLDFMTALGYGKEPGLRHALDHLRRRRRSDGRWLLDAVHPDVEGGIADWYQKNPKKRPTPLALEAAGAPSKMVTLRALRVLARVDGTV
ncbi:MAG TPA: prenyltransferase/squalene oxidase repeat-containing protein [Thermoplasmata archaeon]|nr:prenyltransferase/squalene oxidase repeat-containing protein [Thermoplasmata archaeon]